MQIQNPWASIAPPAADDEHARLVDQLRRLQEAVTMAHPPSDVLATAADLLAQASDALEPFAVAEDDQLTGLRYDLAASGQALVPVQHVDELTDTSIRGRVTFGRYYFGRGSAAHGGSIPLLWDEVLGSLVQSDGKEKRTAFLHVDYRSITPIGRELVFTAQVDRVEGRKHFASGRLMDGDVLTAEAHGLFVALRPGQP